MVVAVVQYAREGRDAAGELGEAGPDLLALPGRGRGPVVALHRMEKEVVELLHQLLLVERPAQRHGVAADGCPEDLYLEQLVDGEAVEAPPLLLPGRREALLERHVAEILHEYDAVFAVPVVYLRDRDAARGEAVADLDEHPVLLGNRLVARHRHGASSGKEDAVEGADGGVALEADRPARRAPGRRERADPVFL